MTAQSQTVGNPLRPAATRPAAHARKRNILPGFGLSLGITLTYLCLIALIPLSTVFLKTAGMGWARFWTVISSPRVLAAYRLSFTASFFGASFDAFAGLLVAWALVRYEFPGRDLADALVDLPFALPTAVAGITSDHAICRKMAGSAGTLSCSGSRSPLPRSAS